MLSFGPLTHYSVATLIDSLKPHYPYSLSCFTTDKFLMASSMNSCLSFPHKIPGTNLSMIPPEESWSYLQTMGEE